MSAVYFETSELVLDIKRQHTGYSAHTASLDSHTHTDVMLLLFNTKLKSFRNAGTRFSSTQRTAEFKAFLQLWQTPQM